MNTKHTYEIPQNKREIKATKLKKEKVGKIK